MSGTAIIGSASTSTEVKLEDNAEKNLELIKENVDAANECDNQCDKTSYHNASTLVLGEKTKKSNGSDVSPILNDKGHRKLIKIQFTARSRLDRATQ